ncbi:MAG: non-ribosomal peptide synthetase [Bryobacteraceae bacterium]|jgi:amino acid adenylation domain-containing protein
MLTETSIAGMIAAQPDDAMALAARAFRLSYGQLNERSAGLAHGLRLLGVGPDVPIAVFADRTPAGVVAALSILKAGAGYVPLDPADPAERLEYVLRDAQTPFVLADRRIAVRLPKGAWKVIPLDEEPLLFNKPLEPLPAPSPHHLAYIAYTSGSTGRPVGVEVTHARLLNLIRWHQRALHVTAADNASQLAAPGLDAAVWEIWPYLTAGASLHFPDLRISRAARLLRDWLHDEYITIALASTALAEQLISLDWPCTTVLRTLLTGGGVLRHYPPAGLPFKLVNNYGPTEATVVATSATVPPQGNWLEYPSIGQPIDNVRIAILNESMEPVRNGLTGELYIGGAGLARGYRNQPELTARKFVPDPSDQQARLYRTGDLVRRYSDGQIEFVGRTDDQIAIRGFRLEPSEIECALNSHPQVQSSFAMVREDTPGQRLLVAYVVPAAESAVSTAALRDWLRERLPDYMVPSAIVTLRELPLTPNGKVNRAALPAPGSESEAVCKGSVEARLAQIMASLREVDASANGENVLHAGGNPLLAALLLDRVRHVFGVTLQPSQLFEAPTVSGLAAEIERAAQ